MRVLRSPLLALGAVAVVAATVLLGVAVARVDQTTRPARVPAAAPIDFDSLFVPAEDVQFEARDGVPLRAWLLRGRAGSPAILMGHDLGQDRNALLHLAVPLNREGFHLVLLDFRGHGGSAGRRSTLGLEEQRDLLGAVEFLARREGIDTRRLGAYGTGMGAHAVVLAAAECPALQVLVLDGLYPDTSFPLARELYAGWSFGRRNLAFVPAGVFGVLARTGLSAPRADDELARLVGRDLLLLASETDPLLSAEVKRMYHAIPQQTDADGNLVYLRAVQRDGLWGDDLARYTERVAGFFGDRLARR